MGAGRGWQRQALDSLGRQRESWQPGKSSQKVSDPGAWLSRWQAEWASRHVETLAGSVGRTSLGIYPCG